MNFRWFFIFQRWWWNHLKWSFLSSFLQFGLVWLREQLFHVVVDILRVKFLNSKLFHNVGCLFLDQSSSVSVPFKDIVDHMVLEGWELLHLLECLETLVLASGCFNASKYLLGVMVLPFNDVVFHLLGVEVDQIVGLHFPFFIQRILEMHIVFWQNTFLLFLSQSEPKDLARQPRLLSFAVLKNRLVIEGAHVVF